MKLVYISSDNLPEIDTAVKERVNQGKWLLFRSLPQELEAHHADYFLQVDSSLFALTASGKVLEQMPTFPRRPHIEELFYFSDLPKPGSLSNGAYINSK